MRKLIYLTGPILDWYILQLPRCIGKYRNLFPTKRRLKVNIASQSALAAPLVHLVPFSFDWMFLRAATESITLILDNRELWYLGQSLMNILQCFIIGVPVCEIPQKAMGRDDNKSQTSTVLCGSFGTQLESLKEDLAFPGKRPQSSCSENTQIWHLAPRDENNHKNVFSQFSPYVWMWSSTTSVGKPVSKC